MFVAGWHLVPVDISGAAEHAGPPPLHPHRGHHRGPRRGAHQGRLPPEASMWVYFGTRPAGLLQAAPKAARRDAADVEHDAGAHLLADARLHVHNDRFSGDHRSMRAHACYHDVSC